MEGRKRGADSRDAPSPKRARDADDDFARRRNRSPSPRSRHTNPDEHIIRILMNSNQLGKVIGRGGHYINSVRQQCNVRISSENLHEENRMLKISGRPKHVLDAFEMVVRVLDETSSTRDGKTTVNLYVPHGKAGLLVGQKGATVKELKSRSDVDVLSIGNRDDVEKLNDGDGVQELRTCRVEGTVASILRVMGMINEKLYAEGYTPSDRDLYSDKESLRNPRDIPSRVERPTPEPPRQIPVMAPPRSENDRLLDMYKVPYSIARQVAELQKSLLAYGLDVQLTARPEMPRLERVFPPPLPPPNRDRSRDNPPRDNSFRDVRERDRGRRVDGSFGQRGPPPSPPGLRDRTPDMRARDRERERDRGRPVASREDLVETGFAIPADKAGAVIGKHGTACKRLEEEFRVKISIAKDEVDGERNVTIKGIASDTQLARSRIEDILAASGSRPSSTMPRRELAPDHGTPHHGISDAAGDVAMSGPKSEGGYGYALYDKHEEANESREYDVGQVGFTNDQSNSHTGPSTQTYTYT